MQDAFYKQLRIRQISEAVPGFKLFLFEDGHDIHYRSGQYLTFVRQLGKEEIRRSYSITSSPELGEPLSIGVKRIDNGFFSRELVDRARPGDVLLSIGAGGLFTLPDDLSPYESLFFLAAGSGITPVFPMIKTALHGHPRLSVILVYSNTKRADTIFLQELEDLQIQFPGQFRLILLFSTAANLSMARLHRDRLLYFLQQFGSADQAKQLFYICGPESYMRMCTYTLQEAGIPPHLIRRENFIIERKTALLPAPPDKQTYVAQVKSASGTENFRVDYPDSILAAAKKQGIQMPYSCEAGRCGSCVARLTSGKVWHAYNEVLTDAELAQGLVLTCVAHPVGGAVELTLGV